MQDLDDNLETLDSSDAVLDLKKELIYLYQQEKEIEKRRMLILKKMQDPEVAEAIFGLALSIHGTALEHSSYDPVEIVADSFSEAKDIALYKKYRNKNFYRGREVVEHYDKHPIQVKLKKGKHLTTRGFNRQKTLGQHLEYLCKAKKDADIEERLTRLEEQQKQAEINAQITKIRQEVIEDAVDIINLEVDSIKSAIKDVRKQQLFPLRQANCNLTNEQIASALGVSKRTILRWDKELSHLLE